MSYEQWNKLVSPTIGYIKACPGLPVADYTGYPRDRTGLLEIGRRRSGARRR